MNCTCDNPTLIFYFHEDEQYGAICDRCNKIHHYIVMTNLNGKNLLTLVELMFKL